MTRPEETGGFAPAPAWRENALPFRERTVRTLFWIFVLLFAFYMFVKVGDILWVTGTALKSVDFFAFWAAAKLALAGEPVAAFDPTRLLDAGGYPAEGRPGNLIWLYPPGFLALVVPLGLLPFWLAWCVFIAVSATALALAMRGPAAPLPGGWRLVLMSPAVMVGAFYNGQTSALWTAGLVAALLALRQGRPAVAGLCIALLTLKPQLGLLIPFVLIAEGHWRTIGWTVVFTGLLVAASTLLFGVAYWPAFADALGDATRRLAHGEMPLTRLVSVYGFARILEAGHGTALAVQGTATLVVLVATVLVWACRRAGADLKCAVLCAAIPLATPYAFHYEMTLTVAAGVFLFRDGFGRTPAEALWLFIVWLGAVPGFYVPGPESVALVGPPVAAATLAIALWRAWRRSGAAAPRPDPAEARGRHAGSP